MTGVTGLEPMIIVLKTTVLPLNYTPYLIYFFKKNHKIILKFKIYILFLNLFKKIFIKEFSNTSFINELAKINNKTSIISTYEEILENKLIIIVNNFIINKKKKLKVDSKKKSKKIVKLLMKILINNNTNNINIFNIIKL